MESYIHGQAFRCWKEKGVFQPKLESWLDQLGVWIHSRKFSYHRQSFNIKKSVDLEPTTFENMEDCNLNFACNKASRTSLVGLIVSQIFRIIPTALGGARDSIDYNKLQWNLESSGSQPSLLKSTKLQR